MEEDYELEALRARRLQELQQQRGGNVPNQGQQQHQQQSQAEQKARNEEMKNTILSQILSQEARARLNTIKTAKPEKGEMIENILIQNAKMGAFQQRLNEEEFKKILESVNDRFKKETKVKFDRRRACLDSDSE